MQEKLEEFIFDKRARWKIKNVPKREQKYSVLPRACQEIEVYFFLEERQSGHCQKKLSTLHAPKRETNKRRKDDLT